MTRGPNGAPQYTFCPLCSQRLCERVEVDGATRQACSVCGWVHYPHVAISVSAVVVEQQRVLLVRRRLKPYPGTWMFPSGFLEYGEMPEEGMLRELLEETNLSALAGPLLAMRRSTDDSREPNHLALFFSAHTATGMLRDEAAENLAVSWFALNDLPEIALIHHREIASGLASKEGILDPLRSLAPS